MKSREVSGVQPEVMEADLFLNRTGVIANPTSVPS